MAAVSANTSSTRAQLHRAQGCPDKILTAAFVEGRQSFEDALCNSEAEKAWVSRRASMEDVVQAIGVAREKYHARRMSKAWKWLTLFSGRVTHYSSILDVMVQHHPEYAALAWGAMKLLFVGIENHEESLHQLAKALYRFANCLPRHELKLILYPSPQMQHAVAKLYASLIQFMAHAMHWYHKGSARRAIGAILKPFALDFKDQMTEVDELSRNVDEIADAAAKAELRAVHAKVEDARRELSDTRKELRVALLDIKRLSDLVSIESDRVFKVASCTQSLSTQIQLDVHAQGKMIRTVQLNQIMSASAIAEMPSSGQTLQYCSAFARRQPRAVCLSNSEIEVLRHCSLDIDICYLIMETRTPSDGKILLFNLLREIQNASRPIIWALRFAEFSTRPLCLEDILRILVLHALEINSEALASSDFPITLPAIRAASSQSDWLSILDRALVGLSEVYIILDPDLLRYAAEDNTCVAADLILALKNGVRSARLKIIVSSFGINKNYFAQHSETSSWRAIRTNDAQRQRLMKTKRQHLARVKNIKRSRN
ncbi:MAG: hypothetical protein Q9160_005576 [Pyrenula sp. 1 TL-2023]